MAKEPVKLQNLTMEELLKRKQSTTAIIATMAFLFLANLAFVASFPIRGIPLSESNLPSVVVALACLAGCLPSFSLRKSVDVEIASRTSP
ncbi:MAG: hypothetical protein NWR72_12015 [Bacteroidia bacterium]|nr:hypothetical protein [Bacteroidia bacterium]